MRIIGETFLAQGVKVPDAADFMPSALYLLLVTQKMPYLVAFVGGLFFMLSDTILTGNQYRKELKHGNFYVMLTYILAQSLLILGFVLNGGM